MEVTDKSMVSGFKAMFAYMILGTVLVLGGCAGDGDEREEDRVSAAELYGKAKQALDNKAWDRAITNYRFLQSRYPFGTFTEQAQLELAYAYFKNFEPELAMATLNRFIKTYPTHPHIDYAHYLKGLVNFSRQRGFLTRAFPSTARGRDQQFLKLAFQDFNELINKYPESRYAPDARERMVFLRQSMAEYELDVARYYLRRGAYIAAANRAKEVVENYQETTEVADALAILAQAYDNLELEELKEDTTRVLTANYPDHPYLTGREEGEGFFSRLWPFGDDD